MRIATGAFSDGIRVQDPEGVTVFETGPESL
jgi:hypothetical protein